MSGQQYPYPEVPNPQTSCSFIIVIIDLMMSILLLNVIEVVCHGCKDGFPFRILAKGMKFVMFN